MNDSDGHNMYVIVSYPLLLRRVKATLIDFLLLMVICIIILLISQSFTTPSMFSFPAITLLILSYEPTMTAYSGTLGQRIMGVRVRDGYDPFRKISIWQSLSRFFVKYLIGWVSLITINQNEQKRAIHDFAGNTVMVSEECL